MMMRRRHTRILAAAAVTVLAVIGAPAATATPDRPGYGNPPGAVSEPSERAQARGDEVVERARARVAAARAAVTDRVAAPDTDTEPDPEPEPEPDPEPDGDDADDADDPAGAGLDVLAVDCTDSTLPPHTGFQDAPACVSTAHGEVAAATDNPTLLIVDHPDRVTTGAAFDLAVSTRNLVRDRFLAAGAGGYYVETGLLDDNGLTRGHFHTACRILDDPTAAPDPAPAPGFFTAVEDGAGGADPDTVTITITLDQPGLYQCSAWAGDGSHRMPMMARANQTPAFDSVRVAVDG